MNTDNNDTAPDSNPESTAKKPAPSRRKRSKAASPKRTKKQTARKKDPKSSPPKARVLEEGSADSKSAKSSAPGSVGDGKPDVRITGTIELPRGTHALKTISKLSETKQKAGKQSPTPAIVPSDDDTDGTDSSEAETESAAPKHTEHK